MTAAANQTPWSYDGPEHHYWDIQSFGLGPLLLIVW